MKCAKCQSSALAYDGFGLTCEDCHTAIKNITEVKALEIAFRKQSKQNQKNKNKAELEKLQILQSKKKYFRLRYFEIEEPNAYPK